MKALSWRLFLGAIVALGILLGLVATIILGTILLLFWPIAWLLSPPAQRRLANTPAVSTDWTKLVRRDGTGGYLFPPGTPLDLVAWARRECEKP